MATAHTSRQRTTRLLPAQRSSPPELPPPRRRSPNRPPHLPRQPAGHRPPVRPSLPLLGQTIALQSAALAVLVGLEGSAAGRVVRVLVVAAATAGLLILAYGAGRTARGLIAITVGTVGTVAGAGIGVPHAMQAGLSLVSAVGLVALVTGLALLGAGVVAATRKLRGGWKLLAIPPAFALVQFVLVPLPFAVYAANVPPTEREDAVPLDVRLDYQDVTLTTEDGVHLAGWFVPPRNGTTVLLLHGSGSTRSSVLDHAGALGEDGFGVLLFDARGHGDSAGVAMDFGWYGDLDIGAAMSFLETRSEVDMNRVAAVGLSTGGEQAITAAASDERIRAVVAEGVGRRVPADTASLPDDLRNRIQRIASTIEFTAADLLTGASPPISLREAVRATAPRPILLVAGQGEIDLARTYHAASPSNVDLWELPDVGHAAALASQRAVWKEQVIGFLDDALKTPGEDVTRASRGS